MRGHLLIEHPLQVFSRRYFEPDGDARIRSHHADFCRALVKKAEAMAALSPPADTALPDDADGEDTAWHRSAPFFSTPLPEPDAAWREVSLTGLAQFFANPSRFLLQNRMGVTFPAHAGELPASEPFVASRLDAWQLADRLLPLLLEGRDMDEVLAAAQAGTEFPSGMLGQLGIIEELDALVGFVDRIRDALLPDCLPPLSAGLVFDLEGQPWALEGVFANLRENGLVLYRYVDADGDSGTRFTLSAWISHLFLNAVAPEDVVCETACHFMNTSFSFVPCDRDQARQLLKDLLLLYRTGLNAPLHFFPLSARAFIESNGNIGAARRKWESDSAWQRSESDDVFYRLALRGQADPLDDGFADCARRVMEPMNRLMKRHDDA